MYFWCVSRGFQSASGGGGEKGVVGFDALRLGTFAIASTEVHTRVETEEPLHQILPDSKLMSKSHLYYFHSLVRPELDSDSHFQILH
jgi:hypothetical protein